MVIIWIFVSLILFSVIVIIHELWHFAAARKFWVKVEEFWLGIPPRAKKLFRDKKWTLFSLNWLPIGWFVKLTWEMPNTFLVYNSEKKLYNNFDLEKDIKENKSIFDKDWKKIPKYELEEILKKLEENNADYNLANKPSWQQAIIILAWVFMNFVLAWLIFSILFFIWVKPLWINNKIETSLESKIIPTMQQAIDDWVLIKNPWVILYPVEWSIAESTWIKQWDILTKINSTKINSPEEIINIFSENIWKEINLEILNTNNCDNKLSCINNIIIEIPEDGKIWTYIWENISVDENFVYNFWLLWSIKAWAIETKNQILLTFKWLWILIKKIFNPEVPEQRQEAINQLSWPIWIVDFITNSIWSGVIFVLTIWAIISINLWVFNLLPIPALDGWRFIFITINWLIQKIFWKKIISEKTEWIIHVVFLFVLIALSLLIAYNDLSKIFYN